MELDSLKELWKDVGQAPPRQESDEQILSMLQKKSQSPINKIKRNLFWEFMTVVVMYTFMIVYYFIAYKGRYWELSVILLAVGIIFVWYYYRKNKLLKEMECMVCVVKQNLQRQVETLEKYVRFYFIAGTLLTPIAYFAAGLIVFYKSKGFDGNATFWTIFISVGMVLTVLIYFLNKWYVRKLYGQHIEKLKSLLRQMED